MTRLTGVIDSVRVVRSGANLAADAAAGATTLLVDSLVDFDDDGGTLSVNGEDHTYTAIDEDNDSITLAGDGLAASASRDDPVLTLDANGESEIDAWLVFVDVDGDEGGDLIPAEVESRDRPFFPENSSRMRGLLVEIESYAATYSASGEDASEGWRATSRPYQESALDAAVRMSGDSAVGDLVGGFSSEGDVAGRDFDVAGLFRVALSAIVADGQPLDEYLSAFSRGLWGWGERTPLVTKIQNTGYAVLAMKMYLPEARRVLFDLQTGLAHSGASGSRFNAVIRANYSATTMPAEATGASTNYATFKLTTDVNAGNADTYNARYGRVLEAGFYQLRLELRTITSGDTLDTSGITSLEITDRGPANADENQAYKPASPGTLASGGTDGGSTAPPQTRTVTYTYHSTFTRSYKGDGSLKTFDGDLWVGDLGFGEGNTRSAIWFDDATIRNDVADATVTKVEVYLHGFWRPNNKDGSVVLGYHGDSVAQATWSAISGKDPDQVNASSWGAPEGRWVTLPGVGADFKSGTVRGIVIGPGDSNSATYAFGFYGPDRSRNTPTLRITAER